MAERPGVSGPDVTARKSSWLKLRTRPDVLGEKPETSLRHTREKGDEPMKKTCFFILPALVLFLCSSAFAHSAKELPTLDQDNPLSGRLHGSGVSLRAQPSSGGEKSPLLIKTKSSALSADRKQKRNIRGSLLSHRQDSGAGCTAGLFRSVTPR